jgi:hypothetical protein
MAERIASIPNLPRVAARRLIDLAALSDGALAQLFWQVESDARRRIADRISTRTGEKQKAKKQTGDSEPSQVTLQLADALFALAAAGDRAEIATRLADALSLPRTVATRIIGDLQGEALTIALRAAGIPSDRTTGIILLTVSEAGRSYETLRTLVGLAEDVNPEAAWHVVGLWARAADRSHAARHVPTVARPNMRAGRAGETKIRRLEDLANALGRRTAS